MTAFLLLAGAMTLLAVSLVAIPLLRKRTRAMVLPHDAANVSIYQDQMAELQADLDNGTLSQDQFEHARNELERRLLQDVAPGGAAPTARSARWPGIVAATAVPILAAALYWQLGKPAAITIPADTADTGITQMQQVEAMLPQLEQHLAEQPADATGWKMLGKAYMALERYPDAVRAFDKLALLTPNDAQVLADYADALAMAQGQTLQGKPNELLVAALKLDPNNVKALYLSGFAAAESGDTKRAAQNWNSLLALLPPDSEDAIAVRQRLAELGQPAAAPAPAGASISGTVRLGPGLKSKVQPGDTLFVFARAAEGPRMPLAIVKLQAKDLPVDFSLDDSMAMSPQMKLSNFPQVVVGARISRSGDAMPQPGDLEGASTPAKLGAKGITVTIDRAVE